MFGGALGGDLGMFGGFLVGSKQVGSFKANQTKIEATVSCLSSFFLFQILLETADIPIFKNKNKHFVVQHSLFPISSFFWGGPPRAIGRWQATQICSEPDRYAV